MSKFKYEISDGKLQLKYDKDEDGQPSIALNLHLSEAINEAINKGEKVEGVKAAEIDFTGTKLRVLLDTDKDGQRVLDLEIDLMEALQETGVLS